MRLSAWLTWAMALSEVANAWWGTRQTLPIMAGQAGASGGARWQELIVMATHMVAGLGLIAAWALLVMGFARQPNRLPGVPDDARGGDAVAPVGRPATSAPLSRPR